MRHRARILSIGLLIAATASGACSSDDPGTAADTAPTSATDATDSAATTLAGGAGDTTSSAAGFCDAAENWNELTESDEFTGADNTAVDIETIMGEWLARAEDLDSTAPADTQQATAALVDSVQAFLDLATASDFDEDATQAAFEADASVGAAYGAAGEDVGTATNAECDIDLTL